MGQITHPVAEMAKGGLQMDAYRIVNPRGNLRRREPALERLALGRCDDKEMIDVRGAGPFGRCR